MLSMFLHLGEQSRLGLCTFELRGRNVGEVCFVPGCSGFVEVGAELSLFLNGGCVWRSLPQRRLADYGFGSTAISSVKCLLLGGASLSSILALRSSHSLWCSSSGPPKIAVPKRSLNHLEREFNAIKGNTGSPACREQSKSLNGSTTSLVSRRWASSIMRLRPYFENHGM